MYFKTKRKVSNPLLLRIFDEDEDGRIHAADMVEVLTSFGEKLSKSEARKLVQKAERGADGLIDYHGKFSAALYHSTVIFELSSDKKLLLEWSSGGVV